MSFLLLYIWCNLLKSIKIFTLLNPNGIVICISRGGGPSRFVIVQSSVLFSRFYFWYCFGNGSFIIKRCTCITSFLALILLYCVTSQLAADECFFYVDGIDKLNEDELERRSRSKIWTMSSFRFITIIAYIA